MSLPRRFVSLAFVPSILLLTGIALAGVPAPSSDSGTGPASAPRTNLDPLRCGREVVGQELPCQFRFRSDGGLDVLTAIVTLRDAFSFPIINCLATATLSAEPGTIAFCSCEPLEQEALSDAEGVARFSWSRLGGRGTLRVVVVGTCSVFDPIILDEERLFSSTDLDGSCESSHSTGVVDLGVWAQGFPPSPYQLASDLAECDGLVDVRDLGVFAGGLPHGCSEGSSP